jgi:hypothetical protein
MKNNGGASFSLQRRLQPAVLAQRSLANFCRFFSGAVLPLDADASPSDDYFTCASCSPS